MLMRNTRVASHKRSYAKWKHTTLEEHMPRAHREYAEWTTQRLINWAATIGPATAAVVQKIHSHKAYPEHGLRSCRGIISLSRRFTPQRLETACERAVAFRGVNYTSIKSILVNALDTKPLPKQLGLLPVS